MKLTDDGGTTKLLIFNFLPHMFIRIDFWGITRQIKKTYFSAMMPDEFPNQSGGVIACAVNNKKDWPFATSNQLLQKDNINYRFDILISYPIV